MVLVIGNGDDMDWAIKKALREAGGELDEDELSETVRANLIDAALEESVAQGLVYRKIKDGDWVFWAADRPEDEPE